MSKLKKYTQFQKREDRMGLLLIAPIIFKVVVIIFLPTIFCFVISFTDYNPIRSGFMEGLKEMEFIGFGAYKQVFQSANFWKSVWNTLVLMIPLPIKLFIGFLLAFAFNNPKLKGRSFFRVVYYLPAVSSAVAIGIVWKWMFNTDYGVLNSLLGTNINWIGDPKVVKFSLSIKYVWGGIGSTALMYLAGMQSISPELYEAAELDGATTAVKLFKITLPLSRPMTEYMVITGIIGGLNAFGDNYTIVSSPDSNTAVYWIYAQMKGNLYALTGAASMVLGLIVILASLPNFAKMVKDN